MHPNQTDYSLSAEAARYPITAAEEALRPWRHECFTLGLVSAMVLVILGLLLGYAAATLAARLRHSCRPRRPGWDSSIRF